MKNVISKWKGSFLLGLLSLSGISEAQELPKYLILFKDKANSTYKITEPEAFLSEKSINRRISQKITITDSDLPVNVAYLNQVSATGAKISLVTKWFNGAVVQANETQLNAIKSLPFFKSVMRDRPINSRGNNSFARIENANEKLETSEEWDIGSMAPQLEILGIPQLFNEGITGEGMTVAVIDAGFLRVNQIPYFNSLLNEYRVIDTWNFVKANTDVYSTHTHGTQVLSTMAAYEPASLIGAAPKASYALYLTEDNSSETPLEELNWLCAAERADSVGVDIINSSLGYSYFDDPADSYAYDDMDGKTSMIAQAARMSVRKGILVVNSVGNEGSNSWKFLITPADVDSVLAVGATNHLLQKAGFSSWGPNADGIIKPDVAAVGQGVVVGSTSVNGGPATSNGTSFSAPQIAGFAALLWQKYPQLTVMQLVDIIKKAGHMSDNPDNSLGYGVPEYLSARHVYEMEYLITGNEEPNEQNWVAYPNPVDNELVIRLTQKYILDNNTASFKLMDSSGRYLQTNSLRKGDQLIFDMRSVLPGLYFLQIDNKSNGVTVLKVLKR